MVSLRVLGGSPRRLHDFIPVAVNFLFSPRHRRGLAVLVSNPATAASIYYDFSYSGFIETAIEISIAVALR